MTRKSGLLEWMAEDSVGAVETVDDRRPTMNDSTVLMPTNTVCVYSLDDRRLGRWQQILLAVPTETVGGNSDCGHG